MSGTLYIVATPLGNLEDMTFRAVRILKEVDLIAAEDTRHSQRLMAHYGITTPMMACHEHNETRKSKEILDRLVKGQTIALISDAGTPLISDPGYHLVNLAGAENIPVVPVPGCNAAVAGLSASGLPTDRFLFCGFPPKKQAGQSKYLNLLASESATLVFYESPKRVKILISRAIDSFGNRKACLAREMTKQYEEFIRGTLPDILDTLEQRDQVKGECVLFVQGAGKEKPDISLEDLNALIAERLASSPKTSDLAKELAASFNLSRKEIYNAILAFKSKAD